MAEPAPLRICFREFLIKAVRAIACEGKEPAGRRKEQRV